MEYTGSYHAAPTTDKPIHRATPTLAHACGDTLSRNCPTWEVARQYMQMNYGTIRRTLNASPSPLKSKSDIH